MKSITWHEVRDFLGGDAARCAAALKAAGFEMVSVKAADGVYEFGSPQANYTLDKLPNVRQDLVDALHAAGLRVWGWGFNYANDPAGEANIAIALVNRFGLDGWTCDWESLAEAKGPAAAAAFIATLRRGLPTTRLAAFVWAELFAPKSGSQWHNPAVYKALLDGGIDEVWPMMYWEVPAGGDGVANSLWLLGESTRQWRMITNKPIVPVGRAYVGDNGIPTVLAINAFSKAVRAGGYPGISWWELGRAFKADPSIWNALAASANWGVAFAPPQVVPADALARLWAFGLAQGWKM